MLKTAEIDGIEFSEASVLIDSKRARMIAQAFEDSDPDLQFARIQYANLKAACVNGKMPSFEDFITMRGAQVQKWLDELYRLNPHWNAIEESAADKEKKV